MRFFPQANIIMIIGAGGQHHARRGDDLVNVRSGYCILYSTALNHPFHTGGHIIDHFGRRVSMMMNSVRKIFFYSLAHSLTSSGRICHRRHHTIIVKHVCISADWSICCWVCRVAISRGRVCVHQRDFAHSRTRCSCLAQ